MSVGRRRWSGLVLAVLVSLSVLGLPQSAGAVPRSDGPSLAVSGLRLLPDGRVEVRAVVGCPVPTSDRFSAYEVGVRQGERSGSVAVDRAPCAGVRQRWSVIVAASDGAPFDGPVVFSFALRTDCSTTSGERVCDGTLSTITDVPVPLASAPVAVAPVLQVRRVRLRADRQVDLRARVRCDRSTPEDFSILQVSVTQLPTANGGEEVRPACTGRPQSLRSRFAASSDAPFTPGPARLLVQVLSDCREEPFDDGEGTFALCLSLTSYERTVRLGR